MNIINTSSKSNTIGFVYLPNEVNALTVPKNKAKVPPNMNPVPIHSFNEFVFAGRYMPINIAINESKADI